MCPAIADQIELPSVFDVSQIFPKQNSSVIFPAFFVVFFPSARFLDDHTSVFEGVLVSFTSYCSYLSSAFYKFYFKPFYFNSDFFVYVHDRCTI